MLDAELAAFAERKLVDHAGDVDELHIEAGGPAFRRQVANVLRIGFVVTGVIFERLLGIAQRLRPGERIQEVKAGCRSGVPGGRKSRCNRCCRPDRAR